MTSFKDKFQSYNKITRLFSILALMGILSSFSLFYIIFYFTIIALGVKSVYLCYQLLIEDNNLMEDNDSIFSQDNFDSGKDEFNILFFITLLTSIIIMSPIIFVSLLIIYFTKSLFIKK